MHRLALVLASCLVGCGGVVPVGGVGPGASGGGGGGGGEAAVSPADAGAVASDGPGDAGAGVDAGQPLPPPTTGLVVGTRSGQIRGVQQDDVRAFLGVPYAAAPVGSLRWRPPAAPAPWSNVRSTTTFGPLCPQTLPGSSTSVLTTSEDCLSLNVWAPPPPATGRRPVMVWIHGGAFFLGSSAGSELSQTEPMYNGHALAAERGVVVVSMNYRLGQLGFLAHPALVAEDPHGSAGNYGLLDQLFALRWVQENVAAFGGDPDNVTLFGESAGGSSVFAHVASPLGAGLFHRAIAESGVLMLVSAPLEDRPGADRSALSVGLEFARTIGCDQAADPLQCMRAKPIADVLEVMPGGMDSNTPMYWRGVVDGYVLREAPWVAFQAGRINRVPLIIGSNADEATMFTLTQTVLLKSDYEALVRRIVPTHVSEVVDTLFPASLTVSYQKAYGQFMEALMFNCPARALSRFASSGAPSYSYYFTRVSGLGGALLGAYHSAEIPYVFGNLPSFPPPSAADAALSKTMMGYWTEFAARGDPNFAGAPLWPRVTTRDEYLQLDAPISAGTALGRHCEVLETWTGPWLGL